MAPPLAALVFVLLSAPPRGTEIVIECKELTQVERDEVSARAQLMLLNAPEPRPRVVHVECDTSPPRVRAVGSGTADEPQRVIDAEPVVSIEPILRAIEQLLARPATNPEPKPQPEPANPAPRTVPRQAKPLDAPEPARARDVGSGDRVTMASPSAEPQPTIGGVGIGLSLEPWPSPLAAGIGPRLDLGLGRGSWSVTSFESLRFGSSPSDRFLAFDALVGVAWGAPFGPERLGALLAFGREWLSAVSSSDPTGERTTASSVANLGLHFGETLGPAALWLSLDGRYRFSPLALEPPLDVHLGRWSLLLSVGGALRVQ